MMWQVGNIHLCWLCLLLLWHHVLHVEFWLAHVSRCKAACLQTWCQRIADCLCGGSMLDPLVCNVAQLPTCKSITRDPKNIFLLCYLHSQAVCKPLGGNCCNLGMLTGWTPSDSSTCFFGSFWGVLVERQAYPRHAICVLRFLKTRQSRCPILSDKVWLYPFSRESWLQRRNTWRKDLYNWGFGTTASIACNVLLMFVEAYGLVFGDILHNRSFECVFGPPICVLFVCMRLFDCISKSWLEDLPRLERSHTEWARVAFLFRVRRYLPDLKGAGWLPNPALLPFSFYYHYPCWRFGCFGVNDSGTLRRLDDVVLVVLSSFDAFGGVLSDINLYCCVSTWRCHCFAYVCNCWWPCCPPCWSFYSVDGVIPDVVNGITHCCLVTLIALYSHDVDVMVAVLHHWRSYNRCFGVAKLKQLVLLVMVVSSVQTARALASWCSFHDVLWLLWL